MFKKILILTIILFFSQNIFSQSKRAMMLCEKGEQLWSVNKTLEAVEVLQKAIEIDSSYLKSSHVLAEMYDALNQPLKSIDRYEFLISRDNDEFKKTRITLAKLYLKTGNYAKAVNLLKPLLTNTLYENEIPLFQILYKDAFFRDSCVRNPKPFDPINLGYYVNSPIDEYFPTLTADENTIIFTRSNRKDKTSPFFQEDFYISEKKDSLWKPAYNVGTPINTNLNEGAQCISPDGMFLVFTACNRPDGKGSCDLYFSRKVGNKWTTPINLPAPVNTPYWESQPSFASDGKTLYFVSNRPNGIGGIDIWTSEMKEDGSWTDPINIAALNTPDHEASPFIHPDNRTIYFSSKGLLGMGGADIYYSRKDSLDKWQTPINIGYPINTFNDEHSFIVGASGKTAYFASDKAGGIGGLDLYSFELYPQAQPSPVSYLKGIVYDKKTNAKLKAKFELIDLKSKLTVVNSFSDENSGSFLVCLPSGKDYALNVSKDGYLFYSENFTFQKNESLNKPFIKNIPLQPIEVGQSIVLNNIFFDTDKYLLRQESFIELEKILQFLTTNKQLKVEIGGHTDNQGNTTHNQKLSENRAKAVYDYLISKGIVLNRLSYKGYGETKPIDVNTNSIGRQNNRRTELKIIGL